ncbi:MAG: hypothetical protein ABJQ86_06970, partial [Cyclobacteriaceae bacterium]
SFGIFTRCFKSRVGTPDTTIKGGIYVFKMVLDITDYHDNNARPVVCPEVFETYLLSKPGYTGC